MWGLKNTLKGAVDLMLTASDNIQKKEIPGLGKATENLGPGKRIPHVPHPADKQCAAHTPGF